MDANSKKLQKLVDEWGISPESAEAVFRAGLAVGELALKAKQTDAERAREEAGEEPGYWSMMEMGTVGKTSSSLNIPPLEFILLFISRLDRMFIFFVVVVELQEVNSILSVALVRETLKNLASESPCNCDFFITLRASRFEISGSYELSKQTPA